MKKIDFELNESGYEIKGIAGEGQNTVFEVKRIGGAADNVFAMKKLKYNLKNMEEVDLLFNL